MKNFNKAMTALLRSRTDEASDLFDQFVSEIKEDGVPSTLQKVRTKMVYVTNSDQSRRFAKVYNHHRGSKQTDAAMITNLKENGQCFYVVKFSVTQPYEISFYKLDDKYYALFHDEDSPDFYEQVSFYDDEDLQSFVNSF